MKKAILICFATLLTATAFGQSKKWTLQECVQHAIDNNITIKQTALDLESAAIDKSDAIGNFLPNINGSASNNWNSGLTQDITTGVLRTQTTRNSSYSITAGVRIFGGMRNHKTLDRAELTKMAADYNISKLKDDIALNVAVTYLGVLLNKENLKVLESQNIVTLGQIERTKDLVEAGVLPRGDLLEIQATNATEKQRMVAAKNSIEISLINLAQLLNIDNYKGFDIVSDNYNVIGEAVLNANPQEILEKAKETRYDLKIAQQNIDIAQKDLEISKTSLYPTIDGFFNYNTRESDFARDIPILDPDNPILAGDPIGTVSGTGDIVTGFTPNVIGSMAGDPAPFIDQLYLNDGISYGVQLSVPVFNGNSRRNQVKRSKVNVRRLEFQKEQAELGLETAVYQAYTDAKAAKESFEAAKTAIESQELAYSYAKDRYDVGLTNAFDFSQSKLRYDNAQIELTRSKYDYIFRLKVLELYFGVPATELKF